MPALRAFSFKFTFALRLFAFCQCFAQFFGSVCNLTKVSCHGHFAPRVH